TSNCVAPNCTVNLDSGPCVSCLTSNSPCIDLCGDATCSVINIGGESDCASTNCAISVAQIDGCASNCVESVAANPGAESSAPINWCTSRATAVQLALNSGKLILLLAGRTTCPNCEYMRYTVCEVASVRQIIDDNFICWFCPIDDSTEWNVYIPTNIVTVYLPVICVIDPGAPTARLDGTMNIQYEAAFLARLAAHLPTQPPLVRSLTVQNGQVKVGWQGAVGYTNRVLRTTALTGNWTMVGAATPGNGTTITNTSPLSGGSAFFRVMGFK
ncbi:MAG: thioredoxin family protein, partial [bacterium]